MAQGIANGDKFSPSVSACLLVRCKGTNIQASEPSETDRLSIAPAVLQKYPLFFGEFGYQNGGISRKYPLGEKS